MLRANRTNRICHFRVCQSQELKYTSNSYFVKNFFADFLGRFTSVAPVIRVRNYTIESKSCQYFFLKFFSTSRISKNPPRQPSCEGHSLYHLHRNMSTTFLIFFHDGGATEYGAARRLHFPISCVILKIGRNNAITIPPITTPRTEMTSGSIRLVMPETAAST